MIDINLDETKSILHIKPNSALKVDDFLQLSAVIDPYLKEHGVLKGLVVEAITFPGWENISAFIAHIKFVKNHQAHIQKVAMVTNSRFADVAKYCIGPFLTPQMKHFPYEQVELAKQWIEQ